MVSKKEGLLRFIAHLSRAAILGYQKFGDEPGLLVIVLVNVGECHVCGVVQNEHGSYRNYMQHIQVAAGTAAGVKK